MPKIEHLHFVGLVRDRDLRDITDNEVINALRANGWREHSDDRRKYDAEGNVVGELTAKSGGHVHFVQQLKLDAPTIGITTLGHFARAMRGGYTKASGGGRMLRYIPSGSAYTVFQPDQGWLITFRHA